MRLLSSARNGGIGVALSLLFRRAGAGGRRPGMRERRLFAVLARRLDTEAVRQRFHLERTFLAVQPSVLNHAATPRRWPFTRFVALINRLQRDGRTVALIGDRSEAAYAAELTAACVTPPYNLVGQSTLADAVALILASEVLVCHDGGLLFIANALAHPTVVLVGPSACVESLPLAVTTRVVSSGAPCAPCIGPRDDAAGLRECPSAVACMQRIAIDDVLAVLPRARKAR